MTCMVVETIKIWILNRCSTEIYSSSYIEWRMRPAHVKYKIIPLGFNFQSAICIDKCISFQNRTAYSILQDCIMPNRTCSSYDKFTDLFTTLFIYSPSHLNINICETDHDAISNGLGRLSSSLQFINSPLLVVVIKSVISMGLSGAFNCTVIISCIQHWLHRA